MVPHQEIVLLFTRFPLPGRSKTRLIPVLGAQGAAELQRTMTEHAVAEASQVTTARQCSIEIHYADGDEASMRTWLGNGYSYRPQADGDIGTRMAQAIMPHLGKKRGVVLIGADCPDISSPLLTEALQAVACNDMVIGPAYDGGYYLIGVSGRLRADVVAVLFCGIPWGAPDVYAQTMARAGSQRLTSHILPKLHDIDRPEDLRNLHRHTNAQ